MAFLDWPQEIDRPQCAAASRRKQIAEQLISRFAAAFPQIAYTLKWESRLINAQAWRLGEQRNVYLYGGLARHPTMRRAGLALTLAHETGHHLGGEPRDPAMRWMTWQGQADYWAAAVAMPTVFESGASTLTLVGARQVLRLQHGLAQADEACVDDLQAEQRMKIYRAGIAGAGLPAFAWRELELSRRDCNRGR